MESMIENDLRATPWETGFAPGARRIGELMPAVLARHGVDPQVVEEQRRCRMLQITRSADSMMGTAELMATV
ncbi:MAG TPA: hypothetical protein VG056_03500 [Pirellulales bacterium]|jgi:hypothetical protein|nr:hypothetical protein [Pirellulales bacterium]